MPDNIAQLEFVLRDFESIQDIANEVLSRAADGKRVVLVVRIYDSRGVLTKHARMMQVLRIRSEAFFRWMPARYPEMSFWRRWWIDRRKSRLAARSLDARSKLIELALSELKATIKAGRPVGVEDYPAAPLRLAGRNELHELLETAGRAKSIRAFIFKPNELLADRNTPVAYTF